MAKLTRLTGKVFAGLADLTDLGVFGSAKAGSGTNPTGTNTEAQIQANAAYEEGWTSAVVTNKNFPPIEEVNGVLRTISYQNCYLLQEGIPTYDSATEYSNTSIVKSVGSGGELILFVSLQDANTGHQPGASGSESWWTRAIFTGTSPIGVPQITLNYNLVDAPENCVWLEGALDGIPDSGNTCYFPNLYTIYGTAYNTSDTPAGYYQLPDFRDRVMWGANNTNTALNTGGPGYIAAGIPNIKAQWAVDNRSWVSGAVYTDGSNNKGATGESGLQYHAYFDVSRPAATASQANGIYRNDCYTVQPRSIKVRVYTRYQ